MMVAFNVSVLADLGYTDKTRFLDPMEPQYRAKSFVDSDLAARTGDFSDAAIKAKVEFFAGLDAYAHEGDAANALEAYWATHTATTLVTSTKTSGQSSASSSSTTTKASSQRLSSTTTKTSASATRT